MIRDKGPKTTAPSGSPKVLLTGRGGEEPASLLDPAPVLWVKPVSSKRLVMGRHLLL